VILAGRLEFTIAGEQIVLGQGDACTFPASTWHSFRAIGAGRPTRVLWVFSPAIPGTGPPPPGRPEIQD
jgi:mannose-6-phosphate isomerase-like protein (cupin superfamily)